MYLQLRDSGQLEAARWTDLFASKTLKFLGKGLMAVFYTHLTLPTSDLV